MAAAHRPGIRRALATAIVVAAVIAAAPSPSAAGPKPKPTTTTTTRPRDTGAPTTPTNLRVTGTTQTSVSLAWDPSTDNGSFSYVVRQDNNLSWTVPGSGSQTSYTLDWLSPGRTYSFFVYAVDANLNRSGNSNTVTATTQPDLVAPSAPVLTAYNVSPSQVWLRWTESTDNFPSWQISYRLYVNGSLATNLNWINHRDVSLRHLTPGTTYSFKVEAIDSSFNATDSNTATVTTQASNDTVPPTAPTNLHIESDQGCGELWLAWTQSTDNVDPQSAIEYEVYVNGVLSPLAVDTGVGRSFVYATAQGTNSFVVRAVDRTGNTSAPSNTVTGEFWPC